jgi:hypothetical protein
VAKVVKVAPAVSKAPVKPVNKAAVKLISKAASKVVNRAARAVPAVKGSKEAAKPVKAATKVAAKANNRY